MAFSARKHLSALSYDDYEEAELLARFEKTCVAAENRLMNPKVRRELKCNEQGYTPDEQSLKASIVTMLGYDPERQKRPVRNRGRARDDAIPEPLPAVGTELRSCLGDTYIIRGYTRMARTQRLSVVVYEFDGAMISRNMTNLFVGTLPTNEPLVTWPADPRGLKPNTEVPVGRRRVLRQIDLKADRLANDQDYIQDQQARQSGRKY